MKKHEARNLYGKLHSFPPGAQFNTGVGMAILGTGGSIGLWQDGWVSGTLVAIAAVGVLNALWARSRMKEKASLDRQIALLDKEEPALIARIVELRRARQQPFRWLQEAGISDIRIRSYLVKRAEEADRPNASP